MSSLTENSASDRGPPLFPYPGRWAGTLTAISLPLGLILGGVSVNTTLTGSSALLCWGGISAVAAFVLRNQLLREWQLSQRIAARRAETDIDRASVGDAALRTVLDGLDLPILLFDEGRRIGFFNAAIDKLLGPVISGKDLAAAIRNPELLSAADRVLETRHGVTVEFRHHKPVNRLLRARIESLPDLSPGGHNFILMLDDMTDSERMREVRSDFVADVSHELRTPLASVLSIVETLNGAAREDREAQQRFMQILTEQASRMAGIVEDLLSLSRIEMNEHRPPEGVADLGEVVGSIVESARLMAEDRNMTIEVRNTGPVEVIGDSLELSRLFQNLVDNAVKYGDAGSTVVVTIATRDEMGVVSVADRGQGIPREHIPRLTERFYRVDKGRSRAAGGTGLGLAIVKHVVNRHRGRLRVDSRVGEGSTFTVELPRAPG